MYFKASGDEFRRPSQLQQSFGLDTQGVVFKSGPLMALRLSHLSFLLSAMRPILRPVSSVSFDFSGDAARVAV